LKAGVVLKYKRTKLKENNRQRDMIEFPDLLSKGPRN